MHAHSTVCINFVKLENIYPQLHAYHMHARLEQWRESNPSTIAMALAKCQLKFSMRTELKKTLQLTD